MSVRGAAFLLLAAALLVLVGFALPLRSRAAAAHEERLLALRDRERALSELEDLKRRSAALRAVSTAGDPGSLRQAVISSLDDAEVSNVRLTVQPARPPLVASLKFSAEGGFDDLVALSGRIAGPGTGLVLEGCLFISRPQELRLEIDAVGLGEGT